MILRQFLHSDPVAASYLFGCGGRAAAAVVDPVGDIAPYLQAARRNRHAHPLRHRYASACRSHFRRPQHSRKPPAPTTCCSQEPT